MLPQLTILPGTRYGRLVVLEETVRVERYRRLFRCACDCGNEIVIRPASLPSGNTKSCGCLKQTHGKPLRKTHGMTLSPEYRCWVGMRSRCRNPKATSYASYGGRGIKVCPEWEASFEAFYRDMGARPSLKHTLERVDNDRGYEPDNVRWASPKEQASNRRPNHGQQTYPYMGQTFTLKGLARTVGMSPNTLRQRLKRGVALELALTLPAHR